MEITFWLLYTAFMSTLIPTPHSWDELEAYRALPETEELHIDGEWPTIPEMVEISAARFPDRPCFTVFDPDRRVMNYAEVSKRCKKIAMSFRDAGIVPGDRIAVTGKNSPEWALAYLSVLYAGAVVVPIDYQLPVSQAAKLITFAACTYVFTDHEKLEELSQLLGNSLKRIYSLEAGYPNHISMLKSRKKYRKPLIDEDSLAAILFTSGTTGNEKGVMLSHKNFVTDVYQACDPEFITATEEDVFYALLPLHHSYCMTAVFLEGLKHGSELVFAKSFVVRKIIEDMQNSGVTVFMGIPLLFNKFLAGVLRKVREKGVVTYAVVRILMSINGVLKRRFGLNPGRAKWFRPILEGLGFAKINFCISGGGPLPARTFHRFQQLGLDFVQGYGLTETAPIVTLNPIAHFKLTSVGKLLPFIDIRIDNPDHTGTGEIFVKGPNVTRGYYRDPDHTAELFSDDGYLKTGDLGYLDDENYLYLRGRKKNMIVTEGGKNVYPEEIEDEFQLYPAIDQIMVAGYLMDASRQAEGIEALIFPSREYFGESFQDTEVVRSEIDTAVREVNQRFPGYKKITRITLLDEPMDMTSTKKIKRNKVQRTG